MLDKAASFLKHSFFTIGYGIAGGIAVGLVAIPGLIGGYIYLIIMFAKELACFEAGFLLAMGLGVGINLFPFIVPGLVIAGAGFVLGAIAGSCSYISNVLDDQQIEETKKIISHMEETIANEEKKVANEITYQLSIGDSDQNRKGLPNLILEYAIDKTDYLIKLFFPSQMQAGFSIRDLIKASPIKKIIHHANNSRGVQTKTIYKMIEGNMEVKQTDEKEKTENDALLSKEERDNDTLYLLEEGRNQQAVKWFLYDRTFEYKTTNTLQTIVEQVKNQGSKENTLDHDRALSFIDHCRSTQNAMRR